MKRAVVIGVDEYRDERIHDLDGAANDANELADLLTRTGDFDIVGLLLGSEATGNAIRAAVSDLLWRTDAADVALLYFSGHAYDDTYGNGFLAPHDMDFDRPWVEGVRMQELNDLMLKAVNKDVVLLVLDACKAGIAASGEKGGEPVLEFEDAFVDLEAAKPQGRGRIVLASSGATEKSHELLGAHQYLDGEPHAHGAFTFQLLEALSGRAATDQENVTLDDVTAFVDQELKGQTFTFFGSGLQHAKQIALVQATEYTNIATKLNDAHALVSETDPSALFRAISALKTVQPRTVNNQQAKAVRSAIDERLRVERGPAIYYLTARRIDLLDNCPTVSKKVQALLSDISYATLVASDQEPYVLGLILGLWEASQVPDDEGAYSAWLDQMKAVEKVLTEPSRIAKSDNPGVRSRS